MGKGKQDRTGPRQDRGENPCPRQDGSGSAREHCGSRVAVEQEDEEDNERRRRRRRRRRQEEEEDQAT